MMASHTDLIQTLSKRDLGLYNADCAEHVAHLYTRMIPTGWQPIEAIEVCRRYHNGDATEEELSTALRKVSLTVSSLLYKSCSDFGLPAVANPFGVLGCDPESLSTATRSALESYLKTPLPLDLGAAVEALRSIYPDVGATAALRAYTGRWIEWQAERDWQLATLEKYDNP